MPPDNQTSERDDLNAEYLERLQELKDARTRVSELEMRMAQLGGGPLIEDLVAIEQGIEEARSLSPKEQSKKAVELYGKLQRYRAKNKDALDAGGIQNAVFKRVAQRLMEEAFGVYGGSSTPTV